MLLTLTPLMYGVATASPNTLLTITLPSLSDSSKALRNLAVGLAVRKFFRLTVSAVYDIDTIVPATLEVCSAPWSSIHVMRTGVLPR